MLCFKWETDNLGYVCIKQQSRAKSLMVLIYSTNLKIKKEIIEKSVNAFIKYIAFILMQNALF